MQKDADKRRKTLESHQEQVGRPVGNHFSRIQSRQVSDVALQPNVLDLHVVVHGAHARTLRRDDRDHRYSLERNRSRYACSSTTSRIKPGVTWRFSGWPPSSRCAGTKPAHGHCDEALRRQCSGYGISAHLPGSGLLHRHDRRHGHRFALSTLHHRDGRLVVGILSLRLRHHHLVGQRSRHASPQRGLRHDARSPVFAAAIDQLQPAHQARRLLHDVRGNRAE